MRLFTYNIPDKKWYLNVSENSEPHIFYLIFWSYKQEKEFENLKVFPIRLLIDTIEI